MSPYLAGGIFLFYLASIGGAYYQGHSTEAVICKAADEKADIQAYQHKDEVTTKQNAINQSEVKLYEKDFNTIGTLYSSGLPTSNVANLPSTGNTPVRICTNSSKQYKLTLKQCDIEEAKLKALWEWANQQSAVK